VNASARTLPVLVSSHADRVTCTPYRAVLSARGCLQNQATAGNPEASSDRRISLGHCAGCPVGLRVASDLRGVKDPRGVPTVAKGMRYGRRGP